MWYHRLVYGNHLHIFRQFSDRRLHPYRSYLSLDVSNIRYGSFYFSIIPKNPFFSYMASRFLVCCFNFCSGIHNRNYSEKLESLSMELRTRHMESCRCYPPWLFLFLVHRRSDIWKTFMQTTYKWKNSGKYLVSTATFLHICRV